MIKLTILTPLALLGILSCTSPTEPPHTSSAQCYELRWCMAPNDNNPDNYICLDAEIRSSSECNKEAKNFPGYDGYCEQRLIEKECS